MLISNLISENAPRRMHSHGHVQSVQSLYSHICTYFVYKLCASHHVCANIHTRQIIILFIRTSMPVALCQYVAPKCCSCYVWVQVLFQEKPCGDEVEKSELSFRKYLNLQRNDDSYAAKTSSQRPLGDQRGWMFIVHQFWHTLILVEL